MSNKDFEKFAERVQLGLDRAYEKMLQHKAALGESIAKLDDNGEVVIIPAREILDSNSEK